MRLQTSLRIEIFKFFENFLACIIKYPKNSSLVFHLNHAHNVIPINLVNIFFKINTSK